MKGVGKEQRSGRGPGWGVRVLRSLRSMHGILSLGLLLLVVVSATTGILLGWKKNSDTLQPPTQRAVPVALEEWRGLDQLAAIAREALADRLGPGAPSRLVVDRLDVRPDRGVAKVLFPGDWEVQVVGATGEVRSVARRHSDWIERIHDGSIIGDGFKLIAMTALGLGLLVLSGSGFWMWYGPRRLRRRRQERPDRGGSERERRSAA